MESVRRQVSADDILSTMTAAAAIAVGTTAAASLAFRPRAVAFTPPAFPARSFAPPAPPLRAHDRPNPRRRRFGTRTYWDESYRVDGDGDGDDGGAVFSWYCGWHDELRPFVMEALDWTPTAEGADGDGGVAPDPPAVLVPGVGNDGAIRDM